MQPKHTEYFTHGQAAELNAKMPLNFSCGVFFKIEYMRIGQKEGKMVLCQDL